MKQHYVSPSWSGANSERPVENRSSGGNEALTPCSALRTSHSAFEVSLVTSAATRTWIAQTRSQKTPARNQGVSPV